MVSTYPLASLVLGRMRKKRWIKVPIATFLTDFAVHSLWVHPGIDLHLCVHPVAAAEAARRSGGAVAATGPVVRPDFDGAESRRAIGRQLHALRTGDHSAAFAFFRHAEGLPGVVHRGQFIGCVFAASLVTLPCRGERVALAL